MRINDKAKDQDEIQRVVSVASLFDDQTNAVRSELVSICSQLQKILQPHRRLLKQFQFKAYDSKLQTSKQPTTPEKSTPESTRRKRGTRASSFNSLYSSDGGSGSQGTERQTAPGGGTIRFARVNSSKMTNCLFIYLFLVRIKETNTCFINETKRQRDIN